MTGIRKMIAAFAAVALVFGLMPFPAFADDAGFENEPAESTTPDVKVLETPVGLSGADATQVDVSALSFVYLALSSVPADSEQSIVVGFSDEELLVAVAELDLVGPNGETLTLEQGEVVEGAVLFTAPAGSLETGGYEISALRYRSSDDSVCAVFFENDDAAEYTFDVVEASGESAPDEEVATEVYTVTPEGEYVEAGSIAEAMASAGVDPDLGPEGQAGDESEDGVLTTQASDGFVIVLDPGHGGSDGGASGIGFSEKDVNLKIAQYCKARLEQTPGVTVYMTRTGDSTVSLSDRVDFAVNHNADLVVSLHNNAGGGSGSEVIVPRNGSWYYEETYATGTELGRKILAKLNALGLGTHAGVYSRDCTSGERYPDGTLSDYFTLIEGPRWEGICGIIVEHAFVDNASDAAFLRSDANLKRLGEADADAIIEYYNSSEGIKRLYWGVYDYDYYLSHNDDVKRVYGTSKVKVFGHFKNNGMDEARRGNVLFDVNYYKSHYSDLVKAFGNNLPKYYQHFIEFGMKEGRQASAEFSPSAYKAAYPDLQKAFGSDWKSYYKHYVDNGIKEGRSGTGNVSGGGSSSSSGSSTSSSTVTVYRVYNTQDGEHFYTTSAHERSVLLSRGNWRDEGVAWVVPSKSNTPVYRLYDRNTGEHHYTTSSYEKKQVLATGHWNDEGIAWYSDDKKTLPVHRLQNSSSYPHAHHYTLSDYEKNLCTSKWGWRSEGVGWYALSASPSTKAMPAKKATGEQLTTGSIDELSLQTASADDQTVTVYRLYHTTDGEHFYTTSLNERRQILSWGDWNDEGIAWVVPAKSNTPVYRLYDRNTGEHHYTTSENEKKIVLGWGNWNDEGIAWYSDDSETLPVHRLQNSSSYPHAHHYTLSDYEKNLCTSKWGWRSEGTGWYALAAGDSELAVPAGDEGIMGTSRTTVAQMVRRYNAVGKTYPSGVYAKYGASNITQFCQILYEEAAEEGVRAEVVFAQTMHETGWLQFGGDVKADQCNFAGIGATGGGNPGNSFNDWGSNSVRKGLRAQVQHLKAYASTASCNNSIVDPRFNLVSRGCAPTVQSLGGRWATGSGYGDALVNQMQALLKS